MKKSKSKILSIFIPLVFFSSFSFVFADPNIDNVADPNYQIVPCTGAPEYESDGKTLKAGSIPCDYNTLMKGINRVVRYFFVLLIIVIPVMVTYAGFLYFLSTDNPGNKEKAIHMLKSVAIGVFWVFFAYLIVYSLLKWLIPAGTPFINQSGQSNVEGVIQLSN